MLGASPFAILQTLLISCQRYPLPTKNGTAQLRFRKHNCLRYNAHRSKPATTHIFFKELQAAVEAILVCASHQKGGTGASRLQGGNNIHVSVDNMAVYSCLSNRVSTSAEANTLIQLLEHVQFHVEWIPTDEMLADSLTRGGPLPDIGTTLLEWTLAHLRWKKRSVQRRNAGLFFGEANN